MEPRLLEDAPKNRSMPLHVAVMQLSLRLRPVDSENKKVGCAVVSVPATSWPEAAVKARYLLNIYAARLSAEDTRHRALVAALFDDFARLGGED